MQFSTSTSSKPWLKKGRRLANEKPAEPKASLSPQGPVLQNANVACERLSAWLGFSWQLGEPQQPAELPCSQSRGTSAAQLPRPCCFGSGHSSKQRQTLTAALTHSSFRARERRRTLRYLQTVLLLPSCLETSLRTAESENRSTKVLNEQRCEQLRKQQQPPNCQPKS